jgi:hypothetical protein
MKPILISLALLALTACGLLELDLQPIVASESRITLINQYAFGLGEGKFRSARNAFGRVVIPSRKKINSLRVKI